MGTYSDVAIAITNRVDKLMRETFNALPNGHEAIQMMDSMFVREQEGWKLYHNDAINWYIPEDPVIKMVHEFLHSVADGDVDPHGVSFTHCVNYMIMCAEYVATENGAIETVGYQDDPFNVGYSFKLQYDPPPEPEKKPCVPKNTTTKKTNKTKTKKKRSKTR